MERKKSCEDSPLQELNILILGPSGAGKSTWINSIKNYLKYDTLEDAEREGVEYFIPSSIRDIGNLATDKIEVGKSVTKNPQCYEIPFGDKIIRLIDTPGFEHTFGMEQDQENAETILLYIAQSDLKQIHAVCILMKATEMKENIVSNFGFRVMFSHLHKSLSKNVVLCFTYSRSSFHKPSESLDIVEAYLTQLNLLDQLRLTPENTYHMDNEVFRYLCLLQDEHNLSCDNKRQIYEESWQNSTKETKRLFNSIQSIPPHDVADSLQFCLVHRQAKACGKSLAEAFMKIKTKLVHLRQNHMELENIKVLELRYDEILSEVANLRTFLKDNAIAEPEDEFKTYLKILLRENSRKADEAVVAQYDALAERRGGSPISYDGITKTLEKINFFLSSVENSKNDNGNVETNGKIHSKECEEMEVDFEANSNNQGNVNKSYEYTNLSTANITPHQTEKTIKRKYFGEKPEVAPRALNPHKGQDLKILRPNDKNQVDVTNSRKTENLKELNILVMGTSGAGKSTWINSVKNYLKYSTIEEAEEGGVEYFIPSSFTVTYEVTKKHRVKIGNPEETEIGKSVTKCPNSYKMRFRDCTIRLIDTPGFSDTSGMDADLKNMASVLQYIAENDFKEIHAVCILMKANESRTNIVSTFGFRTMLSHLHRSLCENIIFCFTHSRTSFYSPGESWDTLEDYFMKMNLSDKLQLSSENTYSLDNEAFRYLCALQDKHILNNENDKSLYTESWIISVAETERLFEHIQLLPPHDVSVLNALTNIRNDLKILTDPFVRICGEIETELISLRQDEDVDSRQKICDLESRELELLNVVTIQKFLNENSIAESHDEFQIKFNSLITNKRSAGGNKKLIQGLKNALDRYKEEIRRANKSGKTASYDEVVKLIQVKLNPGNLNGKKLRRCTRKWALQGESVKAYENDKVHGKKLNYGVVQSETKDITENVSQGHPEKENTTIPKTAQTTRSPENVRIKELETSFKVNQKGRGNEANDRKIFPQNTADTQNLDGIQVINSDRSNGLGRGFFSKSFGFGQKKRPRNVNKQRNHFPDTISSRRMSAEDLTLLRTEKINEKQQKKVFLSNNNSTPKKRGFINNLRSSAKLKTAQKEQVVDRNNRKDSRRKPEAHNGQFYIDQSTPSQQRFQASSDRAQRNLGKEKRGKKDPCVIL